MVSPVKNQTVSNTLRWMAVILLIALATLVGFLSQAASPSYSGLLDFVAMYGVIPQILSNVVIMIWIRGI